MLFTPFAVTFLVGNRMSKYEPTKCTAYQQECHCQSQERCPCPGALAGRVTLDGPIHPQLPHPPLLDMEIISMT